MKPVKILALCDSPASRTAPTGFARVARNLFDRWHGAVEIEVWGIGFEGWGYKEFPWTIYPAGNQDWNSPKRLNEFLNQLATGGYTHVWLLMDANALCIGDGEKSFPAQLAKCCKKYGIRSMLYFPVDCDAFDGCEIVRAVDVAVTYTEYGRRVVAAEFAKAILPAPTIHVIPHGLDDHFHPVSCRERDDIREKEIVVEGKPFIGRKDFLIVNVNKNEWRKDPLRSLEILAGLKASGVPAKMILRMAGSSHVGGINLKLAADQLGLVDGVDWCQLDAVADEDLPKLYNAADLYLTTTLGEGWGLGITEALGCGTPVAMPIHTSCQEIGAVVHGLGIATTPLVWMELERGSVCGSDTRLRRRVDLQVAIERIKHFYDSGEWKTRRAMPPEVKGEWLNWRRIAAVMYDLLITVPKVKPQDEYL